MKRLNPTKLLDYVAVDAAEYHRMKHLEEEAVRRGLPKPEFTREGVEILERAAHVNSLREDMKVVDLSGLRVDVSEEKEAEYTGGYLPFDVVLYTNHIEDSYYRDTRPQTSFLCISADKAKEFFIDFPVFAAEKLNFFVVYPITFFPDSEYKDPYLTHLPRPVIAVERGEKRLWDVPSLDEDDDYIRKYIYAVLYSFQVLECNNTYLHRERAPEKLNKKRIKSGKGRIPDNYVLTIRGGEKTVQSYTEGGTHTSPRYHFRRGHIRHLASGKKTWVSQCMVGREERGIIEKIYRVET